MISISNKGHDMLRKHIGNNGFVRITIKNGGCSGMTYDAHIVTERNTDEKIVYQERGITVITDDTSLPYLQGLNIDYSDDLISAGFRFNNSSNESSCGCGGSFSVADFPQINKGGMNCGS
ncbi:MAG: HesB/IscA family protein [Desulforhopalus sp.]